MLAEEEIYEKSLYIREFEKLLLSLFDQGLLHGTTHTAIGQELTPIAILNEISEEDTVVSNHRSHAHFISYSNKIDELFLELLGKKNGICGGKSGSQHIHYKNFISNGILGNLIPVSAGIALSNKINKKKNIVYIFLGDGAFGQGVLYETLNFCSLNKLRCVFIIENNFIAQTTPLEKNFAGSFKDRFNAFDINAEVLSTKDLMIFQENIKNIKDLVLENCQPFGIIVNTQRLAAHSKGDDTRDNDLIKKIHGEDFLTQIEKKLSKEFLNKTRKEILEFYQKMLDKNNIDYEIR